MGQAAANRQYRGVCPHLGHRFTVRLRMVLLPAHQGPRPAMGRVHVHVPPRGLLARIHEHVGPLLLRASPGVEVGISGVHSLLFGVWPRGRGAQLLLRLVHDHRCIGCRVRRHVGLRDGVAGSPHLRVGHIPGEGKMAGCVPLLGDVYECFRRRRWWRGSLRTPGRLRGRVPASQDRLASYARGTELR